MGDQLKPAENFPISVELFIVGGRGFNTKSDCDNAVKPIIDLMQRTEPKIIPDDKPEYIEEVRVKFIPGNNRSEPVVSVSYTECEI
jgi:hypothetical protein